MGHTHTPEPHGPCAVQPESQLPVQYVENCARPPPNKPQSKGEWDHVAHMERREAEQQRITPAGNVEKSVISRIRMACVPAAWCDASRRECMRAAGRALVQVPAPHVSLPTRKSSRTHCWQRPPMEPKPVGQMSQLPVAPFRTVPFSQKHGSGRRVPGSKLPG